jgi:hypothetical protein
MPHSVALSWTASTDVVDGYNIYRGSAAGQETTKVNTALVTGTTFTDSTAEVGDDFYIVKSSLGGVESVGSNEVEAVLLPQPPTGLKVTASS